MTTQTTSGIEARLLDRLDGLSARLDALARELGRLDRNLEHLRAEISQAVCDAEIPEDIPETYLG